MNWHCLKRRLLIHFGTSTWQDTWWNHFLGFDLHRWWIYNTYKSSQYHLMSTISNIGSNPHTNLNFSSLALTTKTPITWKRYPTPSYSKWRLNNIYPSTLKWVTNARNWIFSLLGTSKSIHLQYSQRLKKSESVQIIWVKSEKLLAHSTFEPGPSASKNLSLLRLSE